MKRNSLAAVLAACVVLPLVLYGGETRKYGKALTVNEPTSLTQLRQTPGEFQGKRVLIEGTIQEVCQKKGCWITVSDGSGADPIQVKVEDDVIVFPKEGTGWKVKAEGIVSVRTVSREELVKQERHKAEEQGKLESFDPSQITGSRTVVRIEGEGAEIVHDEPGSGETDRNKN